MLAVRRELRIAGAWHCWNMELLELRVAGACGSDGLASERRRGGDGQVSRVGCKTRTRSVLMSVTGIGIGMAYVCICET